MGIRLGKIAGVPIVLSENWAFFVGLLSLITMFTSGLTSAFNSLLAMLFLTLFIILHELGHTLTALAFGAKTDLISLNFFGGAAQISQSGWHKLLAKPFNAMLMWMAGPAVSLLLSFALLYPLKFMTPHTYIADGMLWLGRLNFMLAIFNLMPVYPLDGGGILYCIMRFVFSKPVAIKITSVVGIVGSIIFIIIAFKFKAMMLGFIGIMALLSSLKVPKNKLFA